MSDAFPISQDAQQGKLTTPLGADVLGLSRFSCVEGLSELFEIRIEAVSTQANIDFSSALGLGATIELNTQDGQKRYFHGIMTEARWAGSKEDLSVYQMVLRPWLWLLTRCSDCKIFPQMTPNDIIKKVFSDRGFSDFRDASTAGPTLEYCVQYRETDFNFVSRLMEHFGIYYFFEHADGKHTLVLADAISCHSPAPGLSTVEYNPVDDAERRESQYIETWSLGRRLQTGVFVLEDYGYKTPSANLLAQSQDPGGYGHNSMEMFDYTYTYVDTEGNNFVTQSQGKNFAKYRLQAAQSLDQRRSAMGAAPSLFSGALVTLQKHPDDGQNKEYLLTHCTHDFEEAEYRSGAARRRRREGRRLRGQRRIRRKLRADAERPPVPGARGHPPAGNRRRPVRARRRPRGDRRRRRRANPGDVLLGPLENKLPPRARGAGLGGRRGKARRPVHASRRRRGSHPVRGRRPGPADRRRIRLQRHEHRADGLAVKEGEVGHSHPFEHGRLRLQHVPVRRHRRHARSSSCAPRET